MRFLVDESTGPLVAQLLSELGHDVLSVYDEMRGAADEDVILRAAAEKRILVTNDKDFGEKVYRERRPHVGVVLLRLRDERASSKRDTIQRLLANYLDRLPQNFVVVTETRVRFGRLPGKSPA